MTFVKLIMAANNVDCGSPIVLVVLTYCVRVHYCYERVVFSCTPEIRRALVICLPIKKMW